MTKPVIIPNKFQVHLREEHTPEYRLFKRVSNEDWFLIQIISELIKDKKVNSILDIGGREGIISTAVASEQNPSITIVDPDPTIEPLEGSRVNLLQNKIQSEELKKKYSLIIASHVWGDLERDNVQKEVLDKLLKHLHVGGQLVLCFNRNVEKMQDLLTFSEESLSRLRYDFFSEPLLDNLPNQNFRLKTVDFETPLVYENYYQLARCCWFLFATAHDDIEKTALNYVPRLKELLKKPAFTLKQRVFMIERCAI